MKFLITGADGQLAREFAGSLEERGADFVALSRLELDITRLGDVLDAFSFHRPSVVINCAAYNYVDRAEEDYVKAYEVNALGARNVAFCCNRIKAFMVHYSTDYVFDGKKQDFLYTEEDSPAPVNEYGKSKLAGERFVVSEAPDSLIFRVSWVFGRGKSNFVYKFLTWSENRDFVKVSCDEFSVPTWTRDIVDLTLEALKGGLCGLFHLTNSGYCSRFEWASRIKEIMGLSVFIRPVHSAEFELPAQRPQFSAMSNRKLSDALGIKIRDWRDALSDFLKEGGFK